jgi:hypothetical protein
MARKVREPIQVYLTESERADLDSAAQGLGVSRSEALRRGIEAVRGRGGRGPLRALIEEGLVAPATGGSVTRDPPPSAAVAPLEDILCELDADRANR